MQLHFCCLLCWLIETQVPYNPVTMTHDLREYYSPSSIFNGFRCISMLSLVFICFTTVSSLLMVSRVPLSLSNRASSSSMIFCCFLIVSLSILSNVASGSEAATDVCYVDFVLFVDVVLIGVLCDVFLFFSHPHCSGISSFVFQQKGD